MSTPSQADVLKQTQLSIVTANKAFWATADQQIRMQLSDLLVNLNNLSAKLIVENIQSRSADFTSASNLMIKEILPQVKTLNASVEKMVNIDNELKSAMSQIASMTQMAGFFASL